MEPETVFVANRVILSHFDTYSAALVFARFGATVLLPDALPSPVVSGAAPEAISAAHDGQRVLEAIVERYQLNAAEVVRMSGFDAWVRTEAGSIRVHLLRFTTFQAPVEAVSPHGGVFAPISALRGSARIELELVRQGFNLFLGA